MPHLINLEELLEEIHKADRPSCLWLRKEDAIKIITNHAEKLDSKIPFKK